MTQKLQDEMYDFFCQMTGEEVIRFLTQRLGLQILDDWLAGEMQDEFGFDSQELKDDNDDEEDDDDDEEENNELKDDKE